VEVADAVDGVGIAVLSCLADGAEAVLVRRGDDGAYIVEGVTLGEED